MYYIWRSNLRTIEEKTRPYDINCALASTDRKLQSILSFDWDEQDGFKVGTNGAIWDFIIPKSKQHVLESDCSLYVLNPQQHIVFDVDLGIFLLKFPVKIYREEKYKNVEDCLLKNGINILIQNHECEYDGYLSKRMKNSEYYKIIHCGKQSCIYYTISKELRRI